ncbi:hypothetical protein NDU88_003209 [Pleurodeles waltl]|uniref:Uncharacterized protein n=1 Tax=Pleurodeles waltl TaxID=8319 RepID=A0AAV7QCB1_PLEWA|nr:hypothetical protein NDU88_003209 [Pleurodeles waltl]
MAAGRPGSSRINWRMRTRSSLRAGGGWAELGWSTQVPSVPWGVLARRRGCTRVLDHLGRAPGGCGIHDMRIAGEGGTLNLGRQRRVLPE